MKTTRNNIIAAGWGQHPLPVALQGAYTMIEIALAIAVIGFALVAILGVLPSGMQVQKDNREETIISQDGVYWLEAIRNGATGSVALSSFVDFVVDRNGKTNYLPPLGTDFQHTHEVLGALTAPRINVTNPPPAPLAQVRAITGPAVLRGNDLMNFKYHIHSTVMTNAVNSNLFDIRLSFYWPIRADGTEGNNVKVFRTVVGGSITNFDAPRDLWQLLPNRFL